MSGETSMIDGVMGGGWANWVQANASKVVSAYLPNNGVSTLNTATGSNAQVLGAAPLLPASIGGMSLKTIAIIGAVVLAAVIVLPRLGKG